MNIKAKKFSGKCLIDIFLTKNILIRESLTKLKTRNYVMNEIQLRGQISIAVFKWDKEMATHSSILAWRISMDRGAWRTAVHGVARVRHDLVTEPPPSRSNGNSHLSGFMHIHKKFL